MVVITFMRQETVNILMLECSIPYLRASGKILGYNNIIIHYKCNNVTRAKEQVLNSRRNTLLLSKCFIYFIFFVIYLFFVMLFVLYQLFYALFMFAFKHIPYTIKYTNIVFSLMNFYIFLSLYSNRNVIFNLLK